MAIQPGQIHHQRYQFERLIGQGAFGVTWQGQHLLLRRPVAIKVIDASKLDEPSLERVVRECQIGGQLSHAHIVNVLDAYREGADLCIVMEFMAGGSLKEYLGNHRPSLAQGLRWGLDLAEALGAVHTVGIIHRDVKPANILLSEDRQVKMADFGIAHLPGSHLTGTFQPGTPAYRSPEQEENQPVDAATDVYALSAVLFEIFSGEKFFRFKGITQAEWQSNLREHLAQRYPNVPEASLATLAEALANGLAADRTMRSTLSQLRQALAAVLESLSHSQLRMAAAGAKPELSPEPGQAAGTAEQTPIARIGRYELQALIGRGGMGAVHKAYDPDIDRLVALKTITIVDPSWRARFQQEARIAGRLNHPHIVTVYDVGEVGDVAYIVMELVEGQTLADLLPARLAWPEAVKMLLPVCQALDYAHRQGVIHRDVKPANVLLAADGRIKLTDFGIARLETARHLTQTGAVIGTLLYMAPEQLAGKPVDERADIFALGAMLFELITGQNPLAADSAESTPSWGWFTRAPAPDFSQLEGLAPPSLQAAIRRAMAEAPTDRFAATAELIEALTHSLADASTGGVGAAMAATGTLPKVEVSSGVRLSPTEHHLLTEAFAGHDRVYIEGELSSPSPFETSEISKVSGDRPGEAARLLVALPVRSGRPLARVIVKLAAPELLRAEWKAYQEYVADILPLVTANIQGAPLLAPDRKLALLRYTFAGDVGERQAENLANYYQNHTGIEVADLLERNIFQVVAPNWWLNREADLFPLHREYEHLLPVHLVIEPSGQTATSPVTLKAGAVTAQDVRHLDPGRFVQVQGFRVQASRPEQGEIVLEATPPPGSVAERLCLQWVGLSPDQARYQPGDLAPNFAGVIVATRHQLLARAAEAAFPAAELARPVLTLSTSKFPNPLREYQPLLERPVSGMRSIIHGNLTLESILVEAESGLAWLINFADTRSGHNLYDFIQLETQIVTQLLPALVADAQLDLNDEIVAMVRSLHTSAPPAHAPHALLQKPYELLRTVRRLASQCMLDPEKWDEYYLGLLIMLLGALPGSQNDPIASRLRLAWAGIATELVDRSLRPPAVAVPPISTKSAVSYLWLGISAVVIVIILLMGGLAGGFFNLKPTPTPVAVATATPTFTPTSVPTATPTLSPTATTTATSTPSPTSIPTQTPGPAQGVLSGNLPVYSGPGTEYDPVGNVNEGTVVQVTGSDRSKNWWHISWSGGSGWVNANFVEVEEPPNLPTIIPSPPPPFTPTPTETSTPIPPTPTVTRTPLPTGSPTPGPNVPRELIRNTPGYQVLDNQAMAHLDPTSAAFSPNGTYIAATEGIKLYTIGRDGNDPHIWEEEDETLRPVEGIVWSPNGTLIAFVADLKQNCLPPACGRVGIIVRADPGREPIYLNPPEGYGMRFPRWVQDGRLLVTIYKDDPANGTVYIYDAAGRGQKAEGTYVLSSSFEGQRWFPWQPGKTWTVGQGGPTGYYKD
jgi:serine/threonine protein kinase